MDASGRIIAVAGATGRQGGAVTRHLLADGWRVRALTRRPSGAAARQLAERGAEVIGADMSDREALDRALKGVYGVFSVQNPMISGLDAEVTQGRNVADAAAAAGVAHVVYGSAGPGASATGVGSWDSKLVVRSHMESIGLPLTVLRPMAFMELMTDKALYPPVAMWHLMPKFTGSDLPIGWISVDDVGAVAARAFADPDRYIGSDLSLVADVVTNAQCRELWRAVQGRSPRTFPMPVWLFERFVGKDLITMWSWLKTAGLTFDTTPTRAILPTALTVQDWMARWRRDS